jgi:hypothetical protein
MEKDSPELTLVSSIPNQAGESKRGLSAGFSDTLPVVGVSDITRSGVAVFSNIAFSVGLFGMMSVGLFIIDSVGFSIALSSEPTGAQELMINERATTDKINNFWQRMATP